MNGLKNLSEGAILQMATEAQTKKKKEENYKIFYENRRKVAVTYSGVGLTVLIS